MNLLKNIKSFKFLFTFLFCSLIYSNPEPPIDNSVNYDYIRERGDSFFKQGSAPFKGDFVQTKSGKALTQRKNGVLLWEDIPFALPPVGELRWKAPRSFIQKDLNILPKSNNFCHQEIGGEIQEIYEKGSEDCLYLDIRAPHGEREKMPVMFWIHGGGNTSGHKDFYDFSELVKKKDVIVVSTNYRLGPLGFFTHPAIQDLNTGLDKTSNFGILDIILALKWVNENISSFGGDPENITIFGESAGGHNVLSLLVAPQAKGLFNKAISQSGYTKSSSLENAYKSEFFNQEETSDSWTVFNKIIINNDIASNLKDANQFQIGTTKEIQRGILYKADPQDLVNLYGDTFETPLLTNDGIVIPKIGLLKALGSEEHLYKVPTIAGSNKDEIKLWIGFSNYFVKTEETIFSRTLGIPKIVVRDMDKYEFYSSIRARGWQLRGVQEPLESIFYAGNKNVYAYRFDWDNLRDFFIGDFSEIIGSAHAIEIPMVSGDFNLVDEFRWIVYPRTSSRRFVSKNMMDFWTNFAKYAEPGPSSNNINWQKFDPNSNKSILLIDEKKNLRITKLDLTLDSLVEEIINTKKLNDEEKCIILYETSNYIGDNSFDLYSNRLSYNCTRDEALRISKKNAGSIQL
jgi:para-nitrobenzyl esterase